MSRIGRFRPLARLQRRETTRQPDGSELETLVTYTKVWCSLAPRSGEEVVDERQTLSQVAFRVECRHVRGVAPQDRLVFTDPSSGAERTLRITAVMDVGERQRRLRLECIESIVVSEAS